MNSLSILPIQHTNDGHVALLINNKVYEYWCDNAKVVSFLGLLRRKHVNKGKALAIFKKQATLLK